jgi:sugar transferase (PEP-CTERM/EpsH1 system associated)
MTTAAASNRTRDARPLVAHVVYRFDTGGLENGVVNLINRLPPESYRHAIIALTEITDFRARVVRDDVRFVALHKPPGHGYQVFPRLYRVLRDLAPTIVHTRNLAALEAAAPAWLAGVPARVHGEHGRDVGDLDGSNRRYRRVRRLYRPFVSRYVALSKDLEDYLYHAIGVAKDRVVQIYNGVDTERFAPAPEGRATIDGCPFGGAAHWLVGTVGRMQEVKDQLTLARAFVRAVRECGADRLRLVMVGDGPLRSEAERALSDAGFRHLAWLPGERADIAEILRGLDCFVLPSLAEGVSNTILEAMASGLPVIATRVGGNPELVDEGTTGRLVPAADDAAMADAIVACFRDPATARRHGQAARQAAVQRFSLDRMVGDYRSLYDGLLRSATLRQPARGRTDQLGTRG